MFQAGGGRVEQESVRFHIGEGMCVSGEYSGGLVVPPKVVLSWRRHFDVTKLPACKRQPGDYPTEVNKSQMVAGKKKKVLDEKWTQAFQRKKDVA